MSDLKPCPFCGGAARAFKRTCDKDTPYDPADRAFPIVRCGACGACSEGDDWTGCQTAIDKWNRRAQPAQAGQVLIADEICDAWEFITGHQIQFGPSTEGRPMYLCTDEIIEFARAIEAAVRAKLGAAVPMPPEDWSVFNTGAEVASGLTWAEAWDYMTPSRIERGWTAVCVANKSNIDIVGKEGA